MSISIEEFEKGIKPLEKGSLEYYILDLLKIARTKKQAWNEEDILKTLNITLPNSQGKLDFMSRLDYFNKVSKVRSALEKLESEDKIVSKEIKNEDKSGYVTYYMEKYKK